MNEVNQTIEQSNKDIIRNIARTITSTSKRHESLYKSAAKIVEQITGNNVKSARLIVDTFNGIKSRIDVKNEFTLKAWNNFRSMFLRQCKAAGFIVKISQKSGIYTGAIISVLVTVAADEIAADELSKVPDTGRTDTPKHVHGIEPAMDKIAAIMAAYEVDSGQIIKHLIEGMQTPDAVKLMLELGFTRLTSGKKVA